MKIYVHIQGVLPNGMVAVKKLSADIQIEDQSFQDEIVCLMRAKHKNIVRFLGYCADTQGIMKEHKGRYVLADVRARLLCFEYIRNGSLDRLITGSMIYFPATASDLHDLFHFPSLTEFCIGPA